MDGSYIHFLTPELEKISNQIRDQFEVNMFYDISQISHKDGYDFIIAAIAEESSKPDYIGKITCLHSKL